MGPHFRSLAYAPVSYPTQLQRGQRERGDKAVNLLSGNNFPVPGSNFPVPDKPSQRGQRRPPAVFANRASTEFPLLVLSIFALLLRIVGISGLLTLTAIKPTFTPAAGFTLNVGELWDGGHSQ